MTEATYRISIHDPHDPDNTVWSILSLTDSERGAAIKLASGLDAARHQPGQPHLQIERWHCRNKEPGWWARQTSDTCDCPLNGADPCGWRPIHLGN